MRTIGLLGGMSWESTVEYYRLLNQEVRRRRGGLHSAKAVLVSLDFAEVEQLQAAGDWAAAGRLLAGHARRVEAAGAELLLVCTNTMHLLADEVQAAVGIPLLHIADATAERVLADGRRRVGLLGTRFTMEQPFYRDRLAARHGIATLVPDADGRALVHRVIFDELCRGELRPASRRALAEVAGKLAADGAEGVLLACTELPLLLSQADTPVPLYDTTAIHATAAVERALAAG